MPGKPGDTNQPKREPDQPLVNGYRTHPECSPVTHQGRSTEAPNGRACSEHTATALCCQGRVWGEHRAPLMSQMTNATQGTLPRPHVVPGRVWGGQGAPLSSQMTNTTQSTLPWPCAARQGLGRAPSPSQLREMSTPGEPQAWPFLQPARSLGGMIQQKTGSQQVLLQPGSSEVSLGSLAGLCNQGEVVWGARRTRGQICSATGMEGNLAALYWV